MNDEILIRPVRHDDFAKWKVLWDGYNAFYGRRGSTTLPETITTTTWSRFFDGYEPIHALIAERAGQLLGLVHFLFHRTTAGLTSNCYLEDLFTIEAARGKGAARRRRLSAELARVFHLARGCAISDRGRYRPRSGLHVVHPELGGGVRLHGTSRSTLRRGKAIRNAADRTA
jgi:hypothetical protein